MRGAPGEDARRKTGSDQTLPVDRGTTAVLLAGSGFVVLGGLVVAVSGALGLEQGSWVAAYLVLVWGSYQYLLGRAQTLLPPMPPPRRLVWTQLTGRNAGSAAVVSGTLLETPVLVDVGALLLLITLGSSLWIVRTSRRRLLAWEYRAVTTLVMISASIGSVLAHTRGD